MFMNFMYVDILLPLREAIPIMFEHATTHYQTLWTWIGHNATRYHNFNMLPYELLHMVLYISLSLT